MKNCILLLLAISTNLFCVAQNPKVFSAFNGQRELVFIEHFNDDSKGWMYYSDSCSSPTKKTNSTYDSTVIENSILLFNISNNSKTTFEACEVVSEIDYSKNFEIVLRVKIGGKPNKSNIAVLYWGRDCNSINGQNLYIDNKKFVRIFYANLQFEDSIHPDVNKFLICKRTKESFYTYTIRRFEKYYYVFVDRKYLGRCKYVPLTGKLLGLGKTYNRKAWFDYINVYYLP